MPFGLLCRTDTRDQNLLYLQIFSLYTFSLEVASYICSKIVWLLWKFWKALTITGNIKPDNACYDSCLIEMKKKVRWNFSFYNFFSFSLYNLVVLVFL